MIGRIQGQLEAIENNFAMIRLGSDTTGSLTYEVMLPAFASLRLQESVGQSISLQTYHFFESVNQGASLIPRLAGFLSQTDRDFFELFTTCKGIGNKRALRAMTLEPAQIAAAIADRDIAMLTTLPEIGKRMAETVIATLHGKVNTFVAPAAAAAEGKTKGKQSAPAPAGTLAKQALDVLVQLGEQRAAASTWIDEALRAEDRPKDVQALVAYVYRIKSGG